MITSHDKAKTPNASTLERASVCRERSLATDPAALAAAAAVFPPISLDEMDAVKLLNRIDTKYLTSEEVLLRVLEDARAAGYRALETGGKNESRTSGEQDSEPPGDTSGGKIAGYRTVYYDTPNLQMYLNHHNQRLVRQKVRTRVYESSGDTYLEIKRKNNHGRTKKKRTGIAESELTDFHGDTAATAYLAGHSNYTAAELSPALETTFRRITLVNPDRTERLTIDTSLHFENLRTGSSADLERAVIIELKQDGHAASAMKNILLDHRVKPLRISKYCIGITLTDPAAKSNRFKEKVRAIGKVTGIPPATTAAARQTAANPTHPDDNK
ncbi:MAG: polyphosphate polymerase domain-containing protein [Bacteroidales bacterium]|nr:polyphosphate polymerase domain-containing protein [Bacteroidales bacterium]